MVSPIGASKPLMTPAQAPGVSQFASGFSTLQSSPSALPATGLGQPAGDLSSLIGTMMQFLMLMIQNLLPLLQQNFTKNSSLGSASQVANKAGQSGATPGGSDSSGIKNTSTGSTTASNLSNAPAGSRAQGVVDWALAEEKKGINEANNQDYISKNYSQGRVEAWCMDFVSSAFKNNGGSPFGHIASVQGMKEWGEKNGKYFGKGSKQPQAGDVIIFQNGLSHAGLVTKVENGKVYTVEGNSSDAVNTRVYDLNDSKITGYVRPLG